MKQLKRIDTQYIISELRAFCRNLPSKGFIAGGAVAGMINYMVRGIGATIRDVDLFLPVPYNHTEENINRQFVPTDAFVHPYHRRIDDTGYVIIGSSREDNLNTIHCHAVLEPFEEQILKGFDINCCQSGIDLGTGKLFYTPEFEDFLDSNKVYITNVGTPYRSALRLFKKTKDVSGSCDYYSELRILSLAIHLLKPEYKTEKIPSHNLSFLNDRDKETLRSFFTIEEHGAFLTMTVFEMDVTSLLSSGLGNCTSATQFMRKIQAQRKNQHILLPLLDHPIAYDVPNYLENYRDVTLGDVENRRDFGLALRMGWNIGQHCQYSRHAQFSDEITNKVRSAIKEPLYSKISAVLKPTCNTTIRHIPVPTSRPITGDDILAMLNPQNEERREPSLLEQLESNNLPGVSSLYGEINNRIMDAFIKKEDSK